MKTFITTLVLVTAIAIPQAASASQVQGTLTATVSAFDLTIGGTNTNGSDTATTTPGLNVGGTNTNGSDTATTTATTTETTTTTGGNTSGGNNGGGGGGNRSTTSLKGDANKDGKVDILDFVILMSQWNRNGSALSADFTTDGRVDILDFVILMASWSK